MYYRAQIKILYEFKTKLWITFLIKKNKIKNIFINHVHKKKRMFRIFLTLQRKILNILFFFDLTTKFALLVRFQFLLRLLLCLQYLLQIN
jgi:hypothetical protein